MPVSPALKPEPVIVTEPPGADLVGLVEMPGVTVKVIVAEVVGLDAPIVWGPEGEAGTTKVALQLPWELAVIGAEVIALLS